MVLERDKYSKSTLEGLQKEGPFQKISIDVKKLFYIARYESTCPKIAVRMATERNAGKKLN